MKTMIPSIIVKLNLFIIVYVCEICKYRVKLIALHNLRENAEGYLETPLD